MRKETVLAKIRQHGLVGVVRTDTADKAARVAEACMEGGIYIIELTFTVPGAQKIIEETVKRYENTDFIIGAGTVLDSETARIAILSGAAYVVCPYFSADVMRMCNRYRVPGMPGVITPAETIAALESGADILKVFPGDMFGPKIIRALKGPIPQADFMPTGDVDMGHLGDWIATGAVACGLGANLTGGAATGDWAGITAKAREFTAQVTEARQRLGL